MNDEASWHNVQIYYYDDERRDDLVLDCVRPLFASLATRPSFFVRHWLRGPHLRLGIQSFERSLLGFLLSEAVEERFGVSAVELVTAS